MVQLASMDMESVLEVLEILARMLSDVVRGDNTQLVRRIGAWAWGLLGKCREVGQLSTGEVGIIRNLGKRAATILGKVQELEYDEYEEEVDSSVSTQQKEGIQRGNLADDEKDTKEEAQQGSGIQDKKATSQETQPKPTAHGEEGHQEGSQSELTVPNEDENKQDELRETAEAKDSSMPDASLEESDLQAAKMRLLVGLQTNPDSVETPAGRAHEEDDSSIQTHALLDMIITVVGEFFGQRDLLEQREVWD
jgi:regulator of vacuolar morphogenesis